jgi:hypothetical protein
MNLVLADAALPHGSTEFATRVKLLYGSGFSYEPLHLPNR